MNAKVTKTKTQNLREDCIKEGLRIVEERGIEALSLREVARRLGVSHQAPYKHFPSRDHILAEMVRQAYVSFAEFLEHRPICGDPPHDLGAMGQAYLEYALTHPLHYRLMFGTPLPDPAKHPEMLHDARHAFALLKDGIADVHAMTHGPGPLERTEYDALFIWSTLHGLAMILQSRVIDSLNLKPEVIENMPAATLERFGWMLGLNTDAECDS
jgi:AcrR family transcriptional regulator